MSDEHDQAPFQLEFSRPVNCAKLPGKGKTFKIEASSGEREALAKRFGLLSLDKLDAEATVSPSRGDTFNVSGHFRADIVQACVVTFKPVSSSLDAPFERLYSSSVKPYYGNEIEPPEEFTTSKMGENGLEPPDSLDEGVFDLGEVVAEQLSLEMDDFPRAPDASFEGYSSAEKGEGEVADGPFAALAKLENKRK